ELALVKYAGPLSSEQMRALEGTVEKVYGYLPYDTFLVRLPEGVSALESLSGVRWVGPYRAELKVSPSLAALGAGTGQGVSAERLPVMLHLLPEADLTAAASEIGSLPGFEVVGTVRKSRFSRVRVLASPASLAAARGTLARREEVLWIELEGRRVLLNDTTAWVGQSGTTGGQATPIYDHGIFGQGQVIGVLDTGIDPDMCFFRDDVEGLPARNECNGGTVVNGAHRKILAVDFLWQNDCNGGISDTEWDDQNHGTHVAGIASGDWATTPGQRDAGDGMAPAAKVVIQDGGFATDNCADLPGIGCPVVDLNPIFQQAYDQGARIHTNSWGDRENFSPQNIYSAGSEDSDEFMWSHKDFLLLYAAGNSGPGNGTVGSPSTAKNVVSVGSTQRGASAEAMSSFSSCGPTDDGRIKPDVTIPGSSIQSARNDGSASSNNCSLRTLSGTSMASPAAAGFSALIRQYFVDGYYPSGAANAPDGFTPSAALVKAALVNSAQTMTSVGTPIPSNCQGWGRLLLDNVLHLGMETRQLWVEDDTAGFPNGGAGQSRSFSFTVESDQEPFKITLVWTDFPSTPMASTHLVNDLDLEVVGPGGTFLGNVFSGGQSATGGTPDRLNTVEQVLLAAPATGEYTVTVRAFSVPSGPQPFALVVVGDVTSGDPVAIFADGFESGDTSAWPAVMP
ncbi:MAG: S8 family serine peptidase, partial [Acidobacteria bacterium]|nr:S8 family serine peptidase [Acidobacteriota bacterium]